jgi:hypothetical protein
MAPKVYDVDQVNFADEVEEKWEGFVAHLEKLGAGSLGDKFFVCEGRAGAIMVTTEKLGTVGLNLPWLVWSLKDTDVSKLN